jgi:phage terminase large subunit
VYIKVPYGMIPRHYQVDFLQAVRKGQNVCSVIHRRAGKDVISVQAWLLRALTRVGTHVYLFPLIQQARAVIWKGMDFDGRPFLSAIPEILIAKKNEARMEIELINGSRMVLGGSNNYNGLMGTNPVTIIYSEFSLHNPLARSYLNPILVQNRGIEIFQFTPRGKNHGWEVLDTIRDNPNYFVQHLTCEETFLDEERTQRVIPAHYIEEARRMGMSEEHIRQEFYCDFDVGNIGAYFTREMSDMEQEGRLTFVKPNPSLPLHTVWDLGGTDATACWLFQLEGKYINLVGLVHDSGQGLKWYLDKVELMRQSFGCRWGNHFMPHDVKQAHQGWEQAESRLMIARQHGWFFQVTPKVNFEDGIEAMRYVLPKIRIDKTNCQIGIRAIREYQRAYDEARACYQSKPMDNWATHIVDALRYLAVNYRRLYDTPQAQVTYTTSL